jgi:hypothetical protein
MPLEHVKLDDIRLTVVENGGTVSFVAHASAAVALAAACASDPTTLRELLDASTRYDKKLRDKVLNSLSVFDEHNLPENLDDIHQRLEILAPRDLPAFRVLDAVTREASLSPVRAGVVLYNLPARRIVQIENTYEPLAPSGEVNYHNGRFLSVRLIPYRLSPEWTIVP